MFKLRYSPQILAFALMFAAGTWFGNQPAQAQSDTQDSTTPQLSPAEKDAERKARRDLAAEALSRLYKAQPEARKAVEESAGYAVFDITSVYVILFVGQKGTGVLFDNGSKKVTYMSSARVGTGPGVGKQRVFQIFVFKAKDAMEQFMVAGGLGGDVNATYSAGEDGMVRSFNPYIDIYQIPESGMAVQASWGGTVYTVDQYLD